MKKFEFLSKSDLVDEHGYHHFFDIVQQEYIDSIKAENERLKERIKRLEGFCHELIKDCKWLPITNTPSINGFETMVQCTNGKKRVASFRMFDSHWYDVNNGNKLNVAKWLWQPGMPQGEG